MKTIPLNLGKVALVDDADYDALILGPRWFAKPSGKNFYVTRQIVQEGKPGKYTTEMMHKLLCPSGRVDHRDGDGCNNQRDNLRPATAQQNSRNSSKRRGTVSRFKGVSWHKQSKKWVAALRIYKKHHYIGIYSTEEEAARAYDAEAKLFYAEFARLNFP